MGRGRDKTITARDILNMSPQERAGLGALATMGRLKIKGTAVVRDAAGNVRYDPTAKPGQYNEDLL